MKSGASQRRPAVGPRSSVLDARRMGSPPPSDGQSRDANHWAQHEADRGEQQSGQCRAGAAKLDAVWRRRVSNPPDSIRNQAEQDRCEHEPDQRGPHIVPARWFGLSRLGHGLLSARRERVEGKAVIPVGLRQLKGPVGTRHVSNGTHRHSNRTRGSGRIYYRVLCRKKVKALTPAFPLEIRASLWSGRRDSNSRPLAPQASALPGCATPRSYSLPAGYSEKGAVRSRVGAGRSRQKAAGRGFVDASPLSRVRCHRCRSARP